MPSSMPQAKLLQQINERNGTAFTLTSRFIGGEQGAYAISDRDGARFVLKWNPDASLLGGIQHAQAVTERLHRLGYPAPTYRYSGVADDGAYSIQDVLPGRPMAVLSRAYLPRLLALNELQAGQALSRVDDWTESLVETVLVGGTSYCIIESLRTYSDITRELLETVQRLVIALADAECTTADVTHFDFTPANILVEAGEISGVIDWEGTRAGDRVFDLVTLLFYAYEHPELRETLWHEALERTGKDVVTLYLSHLIVRQVDWSIRHHDQPVIEHWLRIAHLVLQDLT